MIEVAALNAERSKHDYLEFRYALMEELIDSSSRARIAGRPHPLEHQQALRLHTTKSIVDGPKRDCAKVREVAGQKRGKGTRHESQIRCSVCNVNLCCNQDRQCFYKYHTLVRHWNNACKQTVHTLATLASYIITMNSVLFSLVT